GGVLAEALRGLAGHPPALRLEGRREVPVVERDEGSDPRLEQGVDGTVVEVQAGRVDRTGAGRLDAWPRDGEAVGIDPEATEQLDVLVPAVEAVAGHGAGGAVADRPRPLAEVVPGAAPAAAGGHAPFDLVARGGRPEDEVGG